MRGACVAAAVAVFAAGCSDGVAAGEANSTVEAGATTSVTSNPSLEVRPSVRQVTVTGVAPDTLLSLTDAFGVDVATAQADVDGNHIFRLVEPGSGYRVVVDTGESSEPFDVETAESSLPGPAFYADQKIVDGYQYIETRDGTTLAAAVYLPPGEGPFPTVVEYSGYDPADPTQDLKGTVEKLGIDAEGLCDTISVVCRTPAQPSSLILSAMGYAVVSVNMRGTGCSGGAYDFFEELQTLDGYDVIETVAAQPWVRHNAVGMVGLSYPGISQLWVAASNPPHLAAIAPLSIFDDVARGVLAPGGVFNEGFALSWAGQVLEKAKPYGQGWEQTLVDQGDTTCAENQKLRSQNVDPVSKARSYPYYAPAVADPLNPALFVDRINVPVFTTGAWQDEQTGPRFSNLWNRFEKSPLFRAIGFNGAHADGYSPETLTELKLFLDITVAQERTEMSGGLKLLLPLVMQEVFKSETSIPDERLLDGTIEEITETYRNEPPITILWDRGGSPENPGAPVAGGSTSFDAWPPRRAAQAWYFGADGQLTQSRPTAAQSASEYRYDPDLGSKVTLPGDLQGQAFWSLPEWSWEADAPGDAAVFVSDPLTTDTVMLGGGSADLWLRTDVGNVEVGVTLSEVRPDGNETYVQSGVMRTTNRAVTSESSEIDPVHSGLESDALELAPGEWTEARLEIMPATHVFRAGSRLRISVHTPGGDKPRWSWILDEYDVDPTITIGHDARHPSRIVLPVGTDVQGYPPDLPPCPSLRGQPCRPFVPYSNTPADA